MSSKGAKTQRNRREELLCLLGELCRFAPLREMPLLVRQLIHTFSVSVGTLSGHGLQPGSPAHPDALGWSAVPKVETFKGGFLGAPHATQRREGSPLTPSRIMILSG